MSQSLGWHIEIVCLSNQPQKNKDTHIKIIQLFLHKNWLKWLKSIILIIADYFNEM